jgi:hypothetical protein
MPTLFKDLEITGKQEWRVDKRAGEFLREGLWIEFVDMNSGKLYWRRSYEKRLRMVGDED